MSLRLSLLLVILSTSLLSQKLDSASFDFWVGDWNLTRKITNSNTLIGYNHIEKILDGQVIEENFADSTLGLYGKSWSIWNPRTQIWKQVWTDNQSGFLEFTGKQYGDSLAFEMAPQLMDGNIVVQRMVFYNITSTSFTRDWQVGEAGTNEWRLLWKIEYQRKWFLSTTVFSLLLFSLHPY